MASSIVIVQSVVMDSCVVVIVAHSFLNVLSVAIAFITIFIVSLIQLQVTTVAIIMMINCNCGGDCYC